MDQSKPLKFVKRLLTILILTMVAISIVPRAQNIFTLTTRKNQLEITKEELLLRNQQLNQDKEELYDPAALERLARERLGMTKEGEQVIIPQLDN